MWQALEAYHGVTYFAPESREATTDLGFTGGWMSYFGLRAAPLGAVGPEVVTALFYSFAPRRVERAVPAVWAAASPTDLLDARTRSVDAALRRLLGPAVDGPEIAEAAELARTAALAAPLAGRALGSANAALPWPTASHLRLWHAQTVLRESRGDGHVAALVTAEVDPCEALVLFAADGRAEAGTLRDVRGWTEQEWSDSEARLVQRGLLDGSGGLTGQGSACRAQVEQWTDLAAWPSWSALGEQGCDRLADLVGPLVRTIVENGGFARDNPMGLVPPS